MRTVSFIVVGAGVRGTGYAKYALEYPAEARVIAVCEPRDELRERFANTHNIPPNYRFRSWRELLDYPKLADAAFICTQDAEHWEPAVELADKGYHLLLEKPMAPFPDECLRIHRAVVQNNVMLAVCHVLRYTPSNRKLKQLIDSGLIGTVHNIQLMEPMGYWHMAHSYVRGNWGNEDRSSFILLAKSVHDIDLLNYLIPSRCAQVSSFGSLSFFRRENKPAGSAERCLDCPEEIERACPWSALKIYIRDDLSAFGGWPHCVLTTDTSEEGLRKALREGPYGRCVFACDNDVCDHQVVNLEFENGTTASFTMAAFNPVGPREMVIMGDKGTLRCAEGDIDHYDFLTDKRTIIPVGDGSLVDSAHGGGDFGLVHDFLSAVRDNNPELITSGPDVSLESHLIVFAAERSRRNGTVEAMSRSGARQYYNDEHIDFLRNPLERGGG